MNYKNKDGETVLFLAVLTEDASLVEKILAIKNVDVNSNPKFSGNTPLLSAAQSDNVKVC